MKCTLCPRACGVDRARQNGYCGVGETMKIGRAALHFWEEPVLAPHGGSGTVFFAGCSLRCVYCQNFRLSRGEGYEISHEELIDAMKRLEGEGADNIEFVTGSHYIPGIAAALAEYRPGVPTVFNCGGYESVEQLRFLDGLIDIYMPDFKYSDPEIARRYSNAPDYPSVAAAALEEMKRQVGATVVKGGAMKRGVLVRHLVLPSNVRNSIGVLDALKDILDRDDYLSLMSQYVPYGDAHKFPEIDRKLKPLEYKAVVAHAEKLGFENVLVQTADSADESFIPKFEK